MGVGAYASVRLEIMSSSEVSGEEIDVDSLKGLGVDPGSEPEL